MVYWVRHALYHLILILHQKFDALDGSGAGLGDSLPRRNYPSR